MGGSIVGKIFTVIATLIIYANFPRIKRLLFLSFDIVDTTALSKPTFSILTKTLSPADTKSTFMLLPIIWFSRLK